jgi:hypothetical protein
MVNERPARFPTLDESRGAQDVEFDDLDNGLADRRIAEDLERANEAMRAVLAENERLKGRVAELEDRCAAVTKLYNAQIEKSKREQKAAKRG